MTLTFFLVVKWSKGKERAQNAEKKWYVDKLEYDFSASVDTGFMLKQHYGFGRVYCTPSSIKEFNYYKEDSLGDHLSKHDRLRFIWKNEQGQVNFMVTSGAFASIADSVKVNSRHDKIVFYKNGKEIGESKISSSLERR